MPQQKEYFHLLSALRGIAAIFVVMLHSPVFFAPLDFRMSSMAVDIFFLLSGVVIEASYQERLLSGLTALHFTWVRLVRIYPLYILGIAVTVFTIIVAPGHHLIEGVSEHVISHKIISLLFGVLLVPDPYAARLGYFPYNHPAWSLFFELVINIFYAFIVTKLSMRRLQSIIVIFAVGFLLNLALLNLVVFPHRHIVEMGFLPGTLIGGFFRAGLSFFLGVIIYRLHGSTRIDFIRRNSAIVSWLLLLTVMGCLMASPPKGAGIVLYLLCVFIIFPVVIYLSLSVQPGKFILPYWQFLGDTSYAVYTLHVPLYYLASSLAAGALGLSVTLYAPWSGACFLAGLLLISYCLGRVYDQPLQKYLRPLWRGRQNTRTRPNPVNANPTGSA